MRLIGILLLLPLAAFSAAPSLRFLGPFQERAVPIAGGAVLVLGSRTDSYPSGAVAYSANTRVATNLTMLSAVCDLTDVPVSKLLGHGNDVPADAAIDGNGNIWIVGTTDSDDFPLVNPLFSRKTPYRASSFVVKFDPTGSKILFSSFLGGPGDLGSSKAKNIALDPSGNAYVLGTTTQADFPQTSPGLGTDKSPAKFFFGGNTYTFVVKISSDGAHLLYSTLIGADKVNCFGGSHCINKFAQTSGDAIAVDAAGIVTIAGATNATNFPVTANAFQKVCFCPDVSSDGFIARISPNGASLIWATFLGRTAESAFTGSSSSVSAIALDTSGNVYAAGSTTGVFPTTSGAVQPTEPAPGPGRGFFDNPFAAKLSSDGSSLLYGTYLGGSRGAQLRGMTLDASGNVWIAGTTTSPDFPTIPNVAPLGNDFVLELNATATALTQLYRLPTGTITQPPAFDSNGNLLLLASRGSLLRLSPVNGLSDPGVLGIANAASLELATGVSPGELVTIFGVGLGPADGVTAMPDANGLFPTELGGVRVLFGSKSKPAPLLYAGPNQINFQVPFEVGYTFQVITPTMELPPIPISSMFSFPGLFHRANSIAAAALNQDGSVNSPSNPAEPGSIVSLFGTGLLGIVGQGQVDGAISLAPAALSPNLNLQIITNLARILNIVYAGFAPGLINGVFQINVQLPRDQKDLELSLRVSGVAVGVSNRVQIYAH